MTVAERLHNQALQHLTKAREAMEQLADCTSDWTAATILEIDFDHLEEACEEFGRCQFGVRSPSRLLANPLDS